ncbi:AlpA family phage regulatory protein [Burkholderia vietnamiensis]|nr:AlpA family phage regulatory protein [Burkholderia vietnamiensis]
MSEKLILRGDEVARMVGLESVQTLTNLAKRGEFPAPIKIGLRINGWLVQEIHDWIERRKAERK